MDQWSECFSDNGLRGFCHDLQQYVAAGLMLSQMAASLDLEDETRLRLDTIHKLFDHIREMVNAEVGEPLPRREIPAPRSGDGSSSGDQLDLAEIVHDCVDIAEAGRAVQVQADVAPTATAYGNSTLLRRALTNILDNAARATAGRGPIKVHVADSGTSTVIEVTDRGIGFGLAAHGSGQGMSVVAEAVRSCHGRLEISSAPAAGTTVRLVLPQLSAAS